MKNRRFGKIYMHKILFDRFCEFQKSAQMWKFLTFLAIFTHYKAFKGIIFIFLIYSRPLWARWCIFQKNPSQKFFDQNHCISPTYTVCRYLESEDLFTSNGFFLKFGITPRRNFPNFWPIFRANPIHTHECISTTLFSANLTHLVRFAHYLPSCLQSSFILIILLLYKL